MKIVKTASGKVKLKISRNEWLKIGLATGWEPSRFIFSTSLSVNENRFLYELRKRVAEGSNREDVEWFDQNKTAAIEWFRENFVSSGDAISEQEAKKLSNEVLLIKPTTAMGNVSTNDKSNVSRTL